MKLISNLQPKILQLVELLDGRPKTERVLIFVTISLAFFLLLFLSLFSPMEKANSSIQTIILTKQAEKELLNQELVFLTEKLRQQPRESALARLASLKQELNSTGEFSELMNDLISPREMIRFVEDVLSSNKRLSVVKVKNMPATQLWPDPEKEAETEKEAEEKISTEKNTTSIIKDEFTIYQHGMQLEVKGRYRELVSFLAALEKLPWNILWDGVSLTTNNNNESVATLMIYTLSPDKAWMGL